MNWLIDFLFGSGDFVSAWGWLIPAASALAGGIAGSKGGQASFQDRQSRRDLGYAAVDQMDFQQQLNWVNAMRKEQGGLMETLLGNQQQIGESAGRGIMGNMMSQGLGNTGLGSSLARGAVAGASQQGNVLRAQMEMERWQQASAARTSQANILAGLAANPGQPSTMNAMTGAVQGLGVGFQAWDAYRRSNTPQQTTPAPSGYSTKTWD